MQPLVGSLSCPFQGSSPITGPHLTPDSYLWLPVEVCMWLQPHLWNSLYRPAKPDEGSWQVSNPQWTRDMPIPACKGFPSELGGRDCLDPIAIKVAKHCGVFRAWWYTKEAKIIHYTQACLQPFWSCLATGLRQAWVREWGWKSQPSLTVIHALCTSWLKLSPFIPSKSYADGQVVK